MEWSHLSESAYRGAVRRSRQDVFLQVWLKCKEFLSSAVEFHFAGIDTANPVVVASKEDGINMAVPDISPMKGPICIAMSRKSHFYARTIMAIAGHTVPKPCVSGQADETVCLYQCCSIISRRWRNKMEFAEMKVVAGDDVATDFSGKIRGRLVK